MAVTTWGTGLPDYSTISMRAAPTTTRGDQGVTKIIYNVAIPAGYYVANIFDLSPYTAFVRGAEGVVEERNLVIKWHHFRSVSLTSDGSGSIAILLYRPYGVGWTAFFIKYGYGKLESIFPPYTQPGSARIMAYIYNLGEATHTLRLELHGTFEVTAEQLRSLTEEGLTL